MLKKCLRIAIIGCAGAGKTTLAKQLSNSYEVPLYHLDSYVWKPGWIAADPALFQKKHEEMIQEPSWIIDGNQMNTLAARLKAADLIIFLDKTTVVCLRRVVIRWFKRLLSREQHSQSKMTWGLLRYVLRYNRLYRPQVLELLARYQNSPEKEIIVISDDKAFLYINELIKAFV